MKDFGRNVVVGVFVLIALVCLGGMILLFGESPQALTPTYEVTMFFPSGGPIQNNDAILVNGVTVGHVRYTAAMTDMRRGVRILTDIFTQYNIPIDAKPIIKEQSVGLGKAAITISVDERNSSDMLPQDGTAKLNGDVLGGLAELVPQKTLDTIQNAGDAITKLAENLDPVAKDLHELLKPLSTQQVDTAEGTDRPMANLATAIQRLDTTLKSMNDILSDPNNKKNFEVILANFRTVSEEGVKLAQELRELTGNTDKRIDSVATSLIASTDKFSLLLDSLQNTTDKFSNGEGTSGRLINDPELYEALNFSAKRLGLAFDDLHQLLQQWREKGLKIQGGILGK